MSSCARFLFLLKFYQLTENRPLIINNTLLYGFKPSNNLYVHHALRLNLLTLMLIMYTLTVLKYLLLMHLFVNTLETSLFHSCLMVITVKSKHCRIAYTVEQNRTTTILFHYYQPFKRFSAPQPSEFITIYLIIRNEYITYSLNAACSKKSIINQWENTCT